MLEWIKQLRNPQKTEKQTRKSSSGRIAQALPPILPPRKSASLKASTHFIQDESGNFMDKADNTGKTRLEKGQLLSGRGQPGLAGFFGPKGDQKLVKVDDPATCVMEGSAGFARSVIPKGYESSVNFAHAGTLSSTDLMEPSQVISIQYGVAGYKQWGEMIYGKKRDPKTLVSYEEKYQDKIFNNIENMSDRVKGQLAVAIFSSMMVGDESLHTGQFIAKADSKGRVTDIIRIDFGARERFSLQRQEKNDFKHQTSDAYKGSGQFGKDYVSYLLAHPDVNTKYLSLWAQEMDINALGEKSKLEFIEQMNNIPKEKREEALKGVWETLSKKSSATKPDPFDINAVGELLKNIVIERAEIMQNSARHEIAKELNNALSNSGIDSVIQNNIKAIVLHWENPSSSVQNIASIIKYLDSNLEDMNSSQLIQLNKALSHLQASQQFRDGPHQNETLNKIDSLKSKISVLTELSAYLDHLNKENKSLISLDKKTLESKIKTVEKAIDDLKQPNASVEKIVTEDFLKKISESRGFKSGEGVKLAQRLGKYHTGEASESKATAGPVSLSHP